MKKQQVNLKTPYLIQRLLEPWESESTLTKLANAFSFGGGLVNGGLSKDAMQLVSSIFRFDYMGAAEFEWGAVPNCLSAIANNRKNYDSYSVVMYNTEVYLICPKGAEEAYSNILEQLAKNKIRLKEGSSFDTALGLSKYTKKEDCRVKGWMDLDNNILFFIDAEMFEKTCALFELPVKEKV